MSPPAPINRLPPGRHGLPRHFVIHSQRERLMRAVAEAAAAEGYRGMTLTHIVQRAGVSRRTFYEHFADKDAALLAAYDAAVEQLVNVLVDALAVEGDVRDRVRAAADALLAFLAAEPAFTRMALVEVPAAGAKVRDRHRRTIGAFEEALQQLRPQVEPGPPPIATRVLIGGIHQVIVDQVLEDRLDELPALRPQIMYLLLLPWLGEAEARREVDEFGAAQPPSPSPDSSASSRSSASAP